MADDRKDAFPDPDREPDDEWDEDDDLDDEGTFLAGFDDLLTPYAGYEVELKGTDPLLIRVVRPSTPTSATILVGVYSDCLVVLDNDTYTVIPQSRVIVSVPRAEWEANEWSAPEQ